MRVAILLVAEILLASRVSAVVTAPPASTLPFIADDYARARSEAQRRHLPLFVEVWAPW